MRIDHDLDSPARPRVMLGAALALALTAYGVVAKRRVPARAAVQARSPARSHATPTAEWRKIPGRVARAIAQKHLTFVAAGAAFYAFLAIPAALGVLGSLALLIFDPESVQRTIRPVAYMMPAYVLTLLSEPHSHQVLGIGLLVSLTADFWAVLSGSACMLTALQLVHGDTSKRGFIDRQMTLLVLAAIVVPFILLSLLLIAVLPRITDLVALDPWLKTTLSVGRWPILMVLFIGVLAAVYGNASHRAARHWQWMSWGVIVAMLLWIAGSALFSAYVRYFVARDQTYGALASILGLLAWLNFTAFTVLLGAQIDAAIEVQTMLTLLVPRIRRN